MLRCSNKECRQANKGFVLLGDKISTEGMGFFKKIFTKLRDVREEIDFDYVDGECMMHSLKDNKEIDVDKTNILLKYQDNKMICKECGHKDSLIKYMMAFDKPMEVFDTDNLCDCGGEIWNDFETVKSDNTEQPDWVEGQSQRKVKMTVKSTTRCERCLKEYPSNLL